jgi:hypothetical protein
MKNAMKDRSVPFALSLACPATALAHTQGGEALGFATGLALDSITSLRISDSE